MSTAVTQLFEKLWQNYLEVTPSAKQVQALFTSSQDRPVVNDHVAFRTFNNDKVDLDKLGKHFVDLGYVESGNYEFKSKHLVAKHFEHPNAEMPKVFISHLLIEAFSEKVQTILNNAIQQVNAADVEKQSLLYSGTHWEINSQDYETLLAESEYAAWLYVWGFRANHFTVSINHLEDFDGIEDVNQTLKLKGFKLNNAGGEVKGCPNQLLEQSSTMADQHQVRFNDATKTIPSCFYEFAKRYKDKRGNMYTGFIAASADKIFESTNNA